MALRFSTADVDIKAGTNVVITITFSDKAGNEVSDDSLGFALAAKTKSDPDDTPTGDDPLKDFVVPAKSYVIVARKAAPDGLPSTAIPANSAEGSSKTTIKAWKDMPNLENLFYEGGSLLLTTLKATLLDRDGDENATPVVAAADQTPQEAAKARDVLITEIMAARNTAKVGVAGYLTHQWIEIYNNAVRSCDRYPEPESGSSCAGCCCYRSPIRLGQ